MRKFYYFKLLQTLVALVLLWRILTTENLCGKFVRPQCFVTSPTLSGHCNNKFTIFTTGAKTMELNMANTTEWLRLNDQPTKDGCLPINISIVSAVRNAYDCGATINQLENTADVLARVLLLCALFISAVIFHTLVQQPSTEYDLCGYLCAAYGIFVWCFATVTTFLLAVNWTTMWECTNFQPDQSIVLSALVLSIVLLCSTMYEMFSNCVLLQDVEAEEQKKQQQLSAVTPKISAVRGLKNDDFFIARPPVVNRG